VVFLKNREWLSFLDEPPGVKPDWTLKNSWIGCKRTQRKWDETERFSPWDKRAGTKELKHLVQTPRPFVEASPAQYGCKTV
jgi:hypothetical protein